MMPLLADRDFAVGLQQVSQAEELPVEQIPVHLARLAAERNRLNAIENVLLTRLILHTANTHNSHSAEQDELVDAHEASRRLGMSTSWLYKNADRLKFARRMGPRALRFSLEGDVLRVLEISDGGVILA